MTTQTKLKIHNIKGNAQICKWDAGFD